ncbi:MAG: ADP-ribosyltransferase [Dysgonamonadaceae bacterium]|jgi:hypothetical protein|nr:ADP-ribosyltransferase [Dysgonamonadaceae bacterium]
MDKNEKRLNDEIKRLLKQLETLIYNNYLAAMNLFQVKNSLSGNTPFWFFQNSAANKQMDRLLANFNKQANALFLNGIERSWKIGEESYIDKMHLALSGKARQRKYFDETRNHATQQQRDQGAHAAAVRFADQKRDRTNLSGRVWNMAKNMKGEIETIIQNGMKEGKTADQLSKELRGYLNEPETIFRKVRNKETDELEVSEAAKKYKPGPGVYRSAYKNAMRLARTEIAAAYRRAELEKFQSDPQVIGIRIELSNNHTCINPRTGKPEPFYDICDELAGDYPKSFLWTGWHPQCRCIIIPILIGAEDFRKMLAAEIKGETYTPKQITEPPKALGEWITRNQERAKGWGGMPYWIKDNKQYASGFQVNTYTPEEYKFTHARKTAMAMSRAIEELNRLYPNIPNTNLAAIHHYTKACGNYRQLNKQLDKGTITDFNTAAATLISKGLEKLPKVEGTIYRGTIMKRKGFDRVYSNTNEVTHKIFTSATQSFGTAVQFATYKQPKKSEVQIIFAIHSRNGRDISKISEFNGIFAPDNQKEVLFDKNTKFRITKQETDKGGTVWIEMTEL